MAGKALRWTVTFLGALFFIVAGTLVLASLLYHIDLLPESSFLYGIDFIPPLWFFPAVAIAVILAWASRRGTAALVLSVMYGILLAGFGDVAIPFFQERADPGPRSQTMSVAALNVRYYSYGLDKVLDEVKRTNADLMLLSENVLAEDQISHVEKVLAPSSFRMDHENGTAIVSRYPIVSYNEITLPSHEASLSGGNDIDSMDAHPHRSFSHAILNVNGTRVHAISIRFIAGRPKDHSFRENLLWGRYLLRVQKQEVEFFTEYLSRLKGPIVFGGDLNAPPRSKTMRELEKIARDAQIEHNFWGGVTFRTEFPTLRIDYLFGMNGMESTAAHRLNDEVSDHFPVYAEFRFNGEGSTPADRASSPLTDSLRLASMPPGR